ncbi:MAG: hypothetical protein GY801_07360 [bacterium]|nr:hypothetical protein [bacterium]
MTSFLVWSAGILPEHEKPRYPAGKMPALRSKHKKTPDNFREEKFSGVSEKAKKIPDCPYGQSGLQRLHAHIQALRPLENRDNGFSPPRSPEGDPVDCFHQKLLIG